MTTCTEDEHDYHIDFVMRGMNWFKCSKCGTVRLETRDNDENYDLLGSLVRPKEPKPKRWWQFWKEA